MLREGIRMVERARSKTSPSPLCLAARTPQHIWPRGKSTLASVGDPNDWLPGEAAYIAGGWVEKPIHMRVKGRLGSLASVLNEGARFPCSCCPSADREEAGCRLRKLGGAGSGNGHCRAGRRPPFTSQVHQPSMPAWLQGLLHSVCARPNSDMASRRLHVATPGFPRSSGKNAPQERSRGRCLTPTGAPAPQAILLLLLQPTRLSTTDL